MIKLKAVLLRRWWLLLTTAVIGFLAGALSASFAAGDDVTLYKADQVIVANRDENSSAFVPQDSLKVTRGEVPTVAAQKLGEPGNESELLERIRVKPDAISGSLTISAVDENPQEAVRVVDAFAAAFLEVVNNELRSADRQQLEQLQKRAEQAKADVLAFEALHPELTDPNVPTNSQTLGQLFSEYRRLQDNEQTARTQFNDAELRFQQRAPYSTLGPEAPEVDDSQLLKVPTNPLVRGGILGGLGLLLGIGLVMVLERVNQRVDTRDELAELLTVPILAEISKLPTKRRPHHPDGRVKLEGLWAEQYRRVRSAIQFVQAGHHPKPPGELNGAAATNNGARPENRVFMFVSVLPSEGKSTSVALTALALAEVGQETLVVSGDVRKPTLERLVGQGPGPTLADRARLDVDRPPPIRIPQPTAVEHLWIAASGPPTSEVSGRLDAAREVTLEGAKRGGTVLIDSTPLQVANDAIDLLPVVDHIVVVVRAGRASRRRLQDALEVLELHDAPIMGALLIGTGSTREMVAYYDSYYTGPGLDEPSFAGGPQQPGPASAPAPVTSF